MEVDTENSANTPNEVGTEIPDSELPPSDNPQEAAEEIVKHVLFEFEDNITKNHYVSKEFQVKTRRVRTKFYGFTVDFIGAKPDGIITPEGLVTLAKIYSNLVRRTQENIKMVIYTDLTSCSEPSFAQAGGLIIELIKNINLRRDLLIFQNSDYLPYGIVLLKNRKEENLVDKLLRGSNSILKGKIPTRVRTYNQAVNEVTLALKKYEEKFRQKNLISLI